MAEELWVASRGCTDEIIEGLLDHERTIVTSLARAWAILKERTEKRTLDRLQGAAPSGQIDEETRRALEEAFRLLWRVRLDHQADMVRAGDKPDDFVDPASRAMIRNASFRPRRAMGPRVVYLLLR